MVQFLIEKIEKNPFISLKNMKEKIKVKYQIDVYQSTIARKLDNRLIIYKKEKTFKQSINSNETKQKRSEFIPNFESTVERFQLMRSISIYINFTPKERQLKVQRKNSKRRRMYLQYNKPTSGWDNCNRGDIF